MIDFHSHIIPAVDDGSESLEQSLTALERMWDQGITHVITTPHFSASTMGNPAAFESRIGLIDEAWALLKSAATESVPKLKLDRGVELALDEPIAAVPDKRLCLAATRFVLVEFPYFTIPPNSAEALAKLRQSGVTPIVAHPERYSNVDDYLEIWNEWRLSGALLQVNAGSLVGAYGSVIESRGWQVVERGLASYISSDYHARGKPFSAVARERMKARKGDSQFRALSVTNPTRMLKGEDPIAVDPIPKDKGRWRGIRAALGREQP